MLGRGAWWSAVGLNATGALLHVAALNYGPLTLVQPLGALTSSSPSRSGRAPPAAGSAASSGGAPR